MSNVASLARPYSKGIFAHAVAQNAIQKWVDGCNCIAQAFGDTQLQALIDNPSIDSSLKQQVFIDLLGTKGYEGFEKLLALLQRNKRINLLPTIALQLAAYAAQQAGTIAVAIISAHKLNAGQTQLIKKYLDAHTGANVAITNSVDKSLLGGFVIKGDDWVLDASLQGKLHKLTQQLLTY